MQKKDQRRDEEEEEWTLHRPDLSMAIWKAMQATDWRHLPFAGGLLEQPDWLIHDLYTISWRQHVLEEQLSGPAFGKPTVAFGG